MSLVDFIKRPPARAIYDRNVARKSMRLPQWEHIVACPDTRLAGAIGTAFDYMSRFRLHALARERAVACLEGEWISETALALMRAEPSLSGWVPRWEKLLRAARDLYGDVVAGLDAPLRVAICAQYLGAADLLVRVGSFRADFVHSQAVTDELVKLDSCFDYACLLPPAGGILCLNPGLRLGHLVGGADPDIISGTTMVDIKTTVRPSADAARLRQVCAYAALSDAGGITGHEANRVPGMTHVALSFSRQNLHVSYALDEIFGGRYETYRSELLAYAQEAA